jgi:uncharacterized membrane protein YhaH (DUF805 family)
MTFLESIKTCLDKYATFSGRASRSEYWWFVLFWIIGGFVLDMIFSIDLPVNSNGVAGKELLSGEHVNVALRNPVAQWAQWIGNWLLFIPFLSVAVRRLHDINRSGWWQLINFFPFVGWIVFLYWMIKKGTPGPNRFGEDPLQQDDNAPITAQISE